LINNHSYIQNNKANKTAANPATNFPALLPDGVGTACGTENKHDPPAIPDIAGYVNHPLTVLLLMISNVNGNVESAQLLTELDPLLVKTTVDIGNVLLLAMKYGLIWHVILEIWLLENVYAIFEDNGLPTIGEIVTAAGWQHCVLTPAFELEVACVAFGGVNTVCCKI